jgi:hypothetical protein
MKVILSIGSQLYLADSAAHAAKIQDLLGQTQPVDRVYAAGENVYELLDEHRYGETATRQVTPGFRFLKGNELKKLIAANQAKESPNQQP